MFSTLSFKNIRKCNESLRHIVTGLVDNKFIKTECLLEFAYGTVSQSIPALNENSKQEIKKKEELKKPDSYIIPLGNIGVILLENTYTLFCSDFRAETYFHAI